MSAFNSLNFKYLLTTGVTGILGLFCAGSFAAAQGPCSEEDLMTALEKAGHYSELTPELKGMEGSWYTKIQKKPDPEKPYARSDGQDVFTITKDGKHLKQESYEAGTKTKMALVTFGGQKKFALATCDSSGSPPKVWKGTLKDGILKFECDQTRNTILMKNVNEMSSRLSLLKKDIPTQAEFREITVAEVSYKRMQDGAQ